MDKLDVVLNSVLEELKDEEQITDLEKDIISAIKVFLEQPIDRNSVKAKIDEIDLKYNTYSNLLMIMPKDSLCSLDELNDVEMRNNLYLRINELLGRKLIGRGIAFNEQSKWRINYVAIHYYCTDDEFDILYNIDFGIDLFEEIAKDYNYIDLYNGIKKYYPHVTKEEFIVLVYKANGYKDKDIKNFLEITSYRYGKIKENIKSIKVI